MSNLVSSALIGLAIVAAAWIIGQNINHRAVIDNGNQNTLAVSGDGKVFAKPDTFLLSVMAQEKAKTTKDAFAKTNDKIAKIKQVLLDNKVEEKDVQSVNINIYPNYNYDNNKTTIDGFLASHGLSIKIRNLDSIDAILSSVSAIDGVQIQSTSYDVDDKTDLYKQAREMAIAKAKQKANDMARAGGVNLGRVMSMSESQYNSPVPYANQFFSKAADMSM